MTRSLLIGSDTLGFEEFGAVADIGERTKVMPGGDGSLDFVLPGDFAWQHRNVLVPEARVILRVDGEVDYVGRFASDPLRHRLGPQEDVECGASGLWGLLGRTARFSYLGIDPDLEPWQQYRGVGEHSGRFTIRKEGFLEIRAENDRKYADGDAGRLYYWMNDGLPNLVSGGNTGLGTECPSGARIEYRSHVTGSNWSWYIAALHEPTGNAGGWIAWGPFDSTDPESNVAAWTAQDVPLDGVLTLGMHCLMLILEKSGGVEEAPTLDQWVKIRLTNGGVVGGWDESVPAPYPPDYAPTVATILADLASYAGVTTTRIAGLTTAVEDFVARYPTTIQEAINQAVLLEAAPVEAYFDGAADGTERFTANARPTSVNPARNRLWSVGGRAGESLRDLKPDWETCPEQVEVLYAVKGDATLPDGMVQAARYPAAATSTYPLVESVDVTGEPPMTAAVAAGYAQCVYTSRQQSRYAGDVPLLATALTSTGQEVTTVKMRPGDRLGIPTLLDCPAEGLYVQRVSYDYRTETCKATVGEPWDPLGFRRKTLPQPQHEGGGGLGRAHRGYRRRSGVV